MRFVRYQRGREEPQWGWVYEEEVGPLEGSPFGEFRRNEVQYPLEAVRLLSPVQPSKIVCIGRNYAEHAQEQGAEVPEIPLLFLKPPSAVIGPKETILLPPQSQQVDHEGELVVVIGKTCRWIQPEAAPEYILGYTVGNDVTARDLQRKDGQWTRGKGFDTFCPLGPWIETDFDPADAMVTCHVNQELRQMASTRDMVFNVRKLVAFISSVMTLLPGDVIMTGTPAGIAPVQAGDVITVTVEGIGALQNPVSRDTRRA